MQEKQMFESPSKISAIAEGLGTGVLKAFDDWIGAKLLAKQARTQREQEIAKANLENKKLALDERRVIYQENVLNRQMKLDEDAAARQEAGDALKAEEEKRQQQYREDYNTAQTRYNEALGAYYKDPSDMNFQNYESSVGGLEGAGVPLKFNTGFAREQYDRIKAEREESEAAEVEAKKETDTQSFYDAYDKYRASGDEVDQIAMIRAAGLVPDDPLAKEILEDPKTRDIARTLPSDEDLETADTEYWNTYRDFMDPDFNPDVETGLADLESKSATLTGYRNQLGKDNALFEGQLENARKIDTERRAAVEKTETEEAAKLTDEQQDELKNLVDTDASLSPEDKNFVKGAIDSGLVETNEEVRDLINDRRKSKSSEKDTPLDDLEAYRSTGANSMLIDGIVSAQTGEKQQYAASRIDNILEGKEFDELTDEQKKSAAVFAMQSDKPLGGETVQKIYEATAKLQGDLASIYQDFTNLDSKTRDKLGILTFIEEKGYQFAGTTTDPKLAALQSRIELFAEQYLRIISGAAIRPEEESKQIRVLPGIGKEAKLNDELFRGLDDQIRDTLTQYYSRRYGKEWGIVISDIAYNRTYDVAEATFDREQRITNTDTEDEMSYKGFDNKGREPGDPGYGEDD